MKNINSRPLFVFEMANNHQGNVKHGLRIIREIHKVSKKFNFNFGFKFQHRDIDTYIHPDFKKRLDIKYVKRFSETKLSEKEFKILKDEVEKLGFLSICTPFDEKSVDFIEKHNFNILKIASCSFTDWPLLERIVKTNKPIIASVGGVPLKDIDNVVSFFQHREKKFTLMHCVGQYPTPITGVQLNQIDLLKKRYPDVEIGYSTHEEPDNFDAVKMAIAKGATVFEKHVGITDKKIELNAYSATPDQVEKWLTAAKQAFNMSGVAEKRMKFDEKEMSDLKQFKRGVFAKKEIKKNEKLDSSNIFFAWPNQHKQLLANDVSRYIVYQSKKNIKKNAPILVPDLNKSNQREQVYKIILEARKFLQKAKISLPDKLEVEISHHYGIDNFYRTGAVMITCVNREYCKKIIILFPGQKHPTHFHKQKEETFQVLSGEMSLCLNNKKEEHKAGDIVLVQPGVKHNFSTEKGVIFEEVSTTHFKNDSFYEDKKIIANKNRKTHLTYWLNID